MLVVPDSSWRVAASRDVGLVRALVVLGAPGTSSSGERASSGVESTLQVADGRVRQFGWTAELEFRCWPHRLIHGVLEVAGLCKFLFLSRDDRLGSFELLLHTKHLSRLRFSSVRGLRANARDHAVRVGGLVRACGTVVVFLAVQSRAILDILLLFLQSLVGVTEAGQKLLESTILLTSLSDLSVCRSGFARIVETKTCKNVIHA